MAMPFNPRSRYFAQEVDLLDHPVVFVPLSPSVDNSKIKIHLENRY